MSDKKKIQFIINPISGVGKQKTVEQLVSSLLDHEQFDVSIVYTQHAKHAIELSALAAKEKIDIVVAVGGDGSVNEVGRSLINTSTALAVIPAGSGNGLARHMNIPLNIEKAIRLLNNYQIKEIDTVTINDEVFIGTAGIGFDAHIGWKFSEYGKRGFMSYIKLTFNEFFKYAPSQYELWIDDEKIETEAFLITFANSSQYGNNAYIAPNAVIDDGYMRVMIMQKFPLASSLGVGYKLFNKKLANSKFVKEYKAKHIKISNPESKMHIDGEPVRSDKQLDIRVVPKSLKIVCSNE